MFAKKNAKESLKVWLAMKFVVKMHFKDANEATQQKVTVFFQVLLAHLSRRLKGELIVFQSSRRLCVCLSVCLFTFSNLNISATSGPIVTKFYLNHHRGGGKAALGFGPL